MIIELFASLGSIWLTGKGIGWAANAPIRAMNSAEQLVSSRAYRLTILAFTQAQNHLIGVPNTLEIQRLKMLLQTGYELAASHNPAAFDVLRRVQREGQALCPRCGRHYGSGRFCQHCGFVHAAKRR
jgi:hypothetical protein